MNYQQSLDYLYSLTRTGIKLGLENTSKLLAYFDNPQLKIRTVHVAGTNGKGSTSAFMESILRKSGYRTGLYTSPHLLDFRERIQTDRHWISKKAFRDLVFRIKTAANELEIDPTFFEFGTTMAFLYFYEQKVDWNIIETGLGGRLDSTNLCHADIAIITSISIDHTQFLGDDLLKITTEKAGIIKTNSAVVTGIKDERLFQIIQEKSFRENAPVHQLGKEFRVDLKNISNHKLKFDYFGMGHRLQDLETSLIGKHQAYNASLAVTAGLLLNSRGCKITDSAIRQGLLTTHWDGRIEIAQKSPILVLDCAHNPESVRILTATLREYFTYKRRYVILGIMKDKAIDDIIEIIDDFADHIILVKPQQERSADPEILLTKLAKSQKVVEIIEEIPYALGIIGDICNPDDIICVTGSIYTVAEAKKSIESKGIT